MSKHVRKHTCERSFGVADSGKMSSIDSSKGSIGGVSGFVLCKFFWTVSRWPLMPRNLAGIL